VLGALSARVLLKLSFLICVDQGGNMPLGKRSEFGDARYAGVDISYSHNIAEHMQVRLLLPSTQQL
jgi:hypothetical protein